MSNALPAPTDRNGKPINLPAVLADHRKWRETMGAEGQRADLRDANLRGAYLGGANLRDADLGGADLGGADLGGAYLRDADLGGADLGGANLRGAYLGGANLRGAYLGGANLRDADLGGADLGGAYLVGATGCVLLTETDHGYRVVACLLRGEWRIWAGCRDFTIAEARAHWGAPDYHTPISGRRVVACLDWLEKEIADGLGKDWQ